jgi:hypothetical protein
MKHFTVSLDRIALANTINRLKAYQNAIPVKVKLITQRLAEIGAEKVFIGFEAVSYQGIGDYSVEIQEIAGGYSIVVAGQAVAFIEFGAGVRFGEGYPGTKPPGIVPIGTYGKGYGSRERGWYFTDLSGSSEHTYGNPPHAVMYKTAQELRERILLIAREVFAGD